MSQNEHSSEINLDLAAIDAIAADLDAMADEPVKPKRKRAFKKVVASTANEPSTDAPKTETLPPMDEDFKAMIVSGVGQGIDFIRDGMELMEPGEGVRENVGKCVAKLLERIKPMQAGPITDVIMIVGYLGVWVLVGKDWSKKKEEVRNVTSLLP